LIEEQPQFGQVIGWLVALVIMGLIAYLVQGVTVLVASF
jgi:hypothetical protein